MHPIRSQKRDDYPDSLILTNHSTAQIPSQHPSLGQWERGTHSPISVPGPGQHLSGAQPRPITAGRHHTHGTHDTRALELPTGLREITQYPEKAPTWVFSLLKVPILALSQMKITKTLAFKHCKWT